MKPILLYHADCSDGFGAAFCYWLKYQNQMEYIPLWHKPLPFKGLDKSILVNRDVKMLDTAFERNDALEAQEISNSFKIIDHHTSSQKALGDCDFCYFDMNHSGAMLAWNDCFPDKDPLLLIRYIEDRDLNRWSLPYVENILAVLDSKPKSFQAWKEVSDLIETPEGFREAVSLGEKLAEHNRHLVTEIINTAAHQMQILDHQVYAVNTPFFKSQIATKLANQGDFGVAYHFDGENFVFSLRSTDDGMNVEQLAKKWGGGGHVHAVGFSIKNLSELTKEA